MKYSAIFCGGDIKLSGKMVLRSVISHLRSVRSHLRKVISQKVFLCRYKPTARDFGKRFDGVIYIFEKNLPKCLVIKNKCVLLHFQNQQNYDNKKGHTNTIPIVAGNGTNAKFWHWLRCALRCKSAY